MNTRIAIDCMGGDHGPSVTVPAALRFLDAQPSSSLLLVGREEILRPLLGNRAADARLRLVNATQTVEMDESPALAMRNKRDSSMRVALNLVKSGEADACVSAGNTGALMAISRFVLKTLPGIDRPALCAPLPTYTGHTHLLDQGANVDCTPEHLLQFGVMGAMLVAAMEQKDRPTVGLLNIGTEEIKGNEVVKAAGELLRSSGLNFVGNVEGDGIYKGEADVIVCDGFVGNVALKTSEGLAQMLASSLRSEFKRNWFTRIAALIAISVLNNFKKRFDHRRYNGAILLGLKGISVKSHGSADVLSFGNAIQRAYDAVENHALERITNRLAQMVPVAEETV